VALVVAAAGVMVAGNNIALFIAFNGGAVSSQATFWSVTTILGHGSVLLALCVWLVATRPRLFAAMLLFAPIAGLAIRVAKRIAEVPRPAAVLAPDQIEVIGQVLQAYSLPSGHALTVFGLSALLFSAAPRGRGWQWLCWTTLLLALLVSLSRVAVGAHWPLDILVGGALGWPCGVAAAALAGRVRWWRKSWARRAMALVVVVASLLLYWTPLGYPLADPAKVVFASVGLLVGSWVLWSPRAAGRQARHWLRARRAA